MKRIFIIAGIAATAVSFALAVRDWNKMHERVQAAAVERDEALLERDRMAQSLADTEEDARMYEDLFDHCSNEKYRMEQNCGCAEECETWRQDWSDCFYGGMERRSLVTDFEACLDERWGDEG